MEQWKVVSASVVGTSHTERGVGCQDFCAHRIVEQEDETFLIAAVADGAGSAVNGAEGAELVCTQFVTEVETFLNEGRPVDELDKQFGDMWLNYVRQRITDVAESAGSAVRDYACTFMGGVVSDESAVFFHIGDGAIVYESAERPGAFFFGVTPEEGVYANTTDFVTDSTANSKFRCEFLSVPVSRLVMFTDGIQTVAIDYSGGPPGVPHQRFLQPMLSPLKDGADLVLIGEKLKTFLDSPGINKRTDDDKTIILAARAQSEPGIVEVVAVDGELQG